MARTAIAALALAAAAASLPATHAQSKPADTVVFASFGDWGWRAHTRPLPSRRPEPAAAASGAGAEPRVPSLVNPLFIVFVVEFNLAAARRGAGRLQAAARTIRCCRTTLPRRAWPRLWPTT